MGNPNVADKSLLSGQVSGASSRYFFLNPGARKSSGVLALGGHEVCNPDYQIERAGFAYHVVEFVVEGSGWVRLGGGSDHALGPGSVFVCDRATRCVMRTDPTRPLVKFFFCLAGRNAIRCLSKAELPLNQVRVVPALGEIRSILEDLIREGRRPGTRTAEICEVLFELLCLKVADALFAGGYAKKRIHSVEGDGIKSQQQERFLQCKAVIDEQAERLMTLEEIAAKAQLDVSSVCRLFRQYQGISPYQYLLRRKMNIAAEFLVDGGGLVKEAAQLVGFVDPLHFSRVFRNVHGLPPSELQMRSRERNA